MQDSDTKLSPKRDQPWAAFGASYGENEDMLEGNREGLLVLRQAIDQAIESGDSRIEESSVEFAGVRCLDESRTWTESTQSVGSKFAMVGCLFLISLAAVIFIFGLIQISHFIVGSHP
ncbi:MAG: hypothetical protein V4672_14305 [Verrucomicrobiota bacterium]